MQDRPSFDEARAALAKLASHDKDTAAVVERYITWLEEQVLAARLRTGE